MHLLFKQNLQTEFAWGRSEIEDFFIFWRWQITITVYGLPCLSWCSVLPHHQYSCTTVNPCFDHLQGSIMTEMDILIVNDKECYGQIFFLILVRKVFCR